MALALIGNICRWIWAFALPPVVNTSSMFSNHKYYLHLEGNLTTYSRMQCVREQEIHHRKDPIKRKTKEGNQKRRAKQEEVRSRYPLKTFAHANDHEVYLTPTSSECVPL